MIFNPVTLGPGRDADPSPPSTAEVKNRVELYLYSPQGFLWPMKGLILPTYISLRCLFLQLEQLQFDMNFPFMDVIFETRLNFEALLLQFLTTAKHFNFVPKNKKKNDLHKSLCKGNSLLG
jgi:hypothetical protein